jgi:hypothetical protein
VFNFGFPVSSSVVLALLLAVVRGEKGGKHGTRVLSKEFFFLFFGSVGRKERMRNKEGRMGF